MCVDPGLVGKSDYQGGAIWESEEGLYQNIFSINLPRSEIPTVKVNNLLDKVYSSVVCGPPGVLKTLQGISRGKTIFIVTIRCYLPFFGVLTF